MISLTVEAHLDGAWRTAAALRFEAPERGIRGGVRLAYDDDHFFELAVVEAMERPVIDRRAVSVRFPVDLGERRLDTWPAWLLDFMPQGVARRKLARRVGLRNDDPALDIRLLREAAGGPIGNLRIFEAWAEERRRLAGVTCPPLDDRDLARRSDRFIDVADRFAHLASGSSGVQGDWPKLLMTRSLRDGFWYPDPFVPTEDGGEHLIVKVLQSSNADEALIIAAEEPYLRVARDFGLRVAAPLRYASGVLQIPRFDRSRAGGTLRLHGQESLVSALGVAEFGHVGHHEDYLTVIRDVSDDPVADTLEYVLRDVLSMAMGDPDNHGRNSALAKPAEGGVRLSPLYDFAPMRLSPAGIARSTRWRCLEGRDLDGDWAAVCKAAGMPGLPPEDIAAALVARIPFLRDLDRIGAEAGVDPEVRRRAFSGDAVARALERLETPRCPESAP